VVRCGAAFACRDAPAVSAQHPPQRGSILFAAVQHAVEDGRRGRRRQAIFVAPQQNPEIRGTPPNVKRFTDDFPPMRLYVSSPRSPISGDDTGREATDMTARALRLIPLPVSYTPLTQPTNREL